MRKTTCGNCGKEATVVRNKDFEFSEMGMPVILGDIDVIECSYCGAKDPIIPNMDGLMDILALGIVCDPCRLTGEEVRFLRKYVNKSAREFARFLHLDHTHLSNIENDQERIGKQTDKLVRTIIVGLAPTLEHEIKRLVEMMPDIHDSCSKSKPRLRIDVPTDAYQYV